MKRFFLYLCISLKFIPDIRAGPFEYSLVPSTTNSYWVEFGENDSKVECQADVVVGPATNLTTASANPMPWYAVEIAFSGFSCSMPSRRDTQERYGMVFNSIPVFRVSLLANQTGELAKFAFDEVPQEPITLAVYNSVFVAIGYAFTRFVFAPPGETVDGPYCIFQPRDWKKLGCDRCPSDQSDPAGLRYTGTRGSGEILECWLKNEVQVGLKKWGAPWDRLETHSRKLSYDQSLKLITEVDITRVSRFDDNPPHTLFFRSKLISRATKKDKPPQP